MGYIEDNLMSDEKLLYRAKLHWAVFLWPLFWLLIILIIAFYDTQTAFGLFFFIFLYSIISAIINFSTSEFGVTDKRVLAKTGFIRRRSVEILLKKAEGIQVDQGVIGRIFGYGSITISGTGGTQSPFKKISRPIEFKKITQQQIDVSQG